MAVTSRTWGGVFKACLMTVTAVFGVGFASLSSAATIPDSVDVLVAGGTVAAVETACAAKAAGKSVLIVSPRPYFGEDTAGRLELEPIPVEDEPIPTVTSFAVSGDGKTARTEVLFDEPTEVTRIEMLTFERTAGTNTAMTETCLLSCRESESATFSKPRQMAIEMNYSPRGLCVWRAELNRKVTALAVEATASRRAKGVEPVELRVFRKCVPGTVRRPTPLEAKRFLDEKLRTAGIPCLSGGMGVEVLFAADRRIAGAVFATRGGLKAVRAKQTIDATVHGVLLKLAGGTLEPLPASVRLSRVVLSAERPSAPGLSVEDIPYERSCEIQIRGKKGESVTGRLYRCAFDWKVDDTPCGWAQAEMRARDLTWTKHQLDAADELTVPVRRCVKAVAGLVYLPVGAEPLRIFETPKPNGPVVRSKRRALRLAEGDVCVVGAGTAGAPATIAAARAGAKTVAVEYQYGLGGVGTMGMVGYYWNGTICGFTAEVEKGIPTLGARVPGVGKREWWRREASKALVFLGSLAYDVVRDECGKVTGVAVATPSGVGVVSAKVTVDATGAADLAACAGERTEFIGADELAVQTAGLPPRIPGFTNVNSDFGFVNDNDVSDTTLFGLRGRRGAKGEWDVVQVVGSRERRRLAADFQVQPEDVFNERTFPDTIATGSTNFDSHGPTVADICFLSPATDKYVFRLNVPYRALLPAKADGLLVCGIGLSGHRDALPFMRMQADVQNIGYAAGLAAALAAQANVSPRDIDVKELQRRLVEIGTIPREALSWKDNFPLSDADWAAAVAAVGDGFKGVPRILTDRKRARRDLRTAFQSEADPERRLCLAQVLGMLGDDCGASVLAENLSRPAAAFVQPVPERAQRFGKRMSNRDAQLVALGRSRSTLAAKVVRAEIDKVKVGDSLSRVRAVTLAAAALCDSSLAPSLARALALKGMGGHACSRATDLPPLGGYFRTAAEKEQVQCLRELALARALFVCGDCDGLGRRTLEVYAADPRGAYAAHARAVLAAAPDSGR